jgi:hypothetical protein
LPTPLPNFLQGLPQCLKHGPANITNDKDAKDALVDLLLGKWDDVIRVVNRSRGRTGKKGCEPAILVPERLDSEREICEEILGPIESGDVTIELHRPEGWRRGRLDDDGGNGDDGNDGNNGDNGDNDDDDSDDDDDDEGDNDDNGGEGDNDESDEGPRQVFSDAPEYPE